MIASGRTGWSRFLTIAQPFFRSEARWKGLGLFALLLTFLLAFNGLNVLNNFVQGRFMTAISDRQLRILLSLALLCGGLFAFSTVMSAFCQYFEESLRLLWRGWLTRHLTDRYLANQAYYRIKTTCKLDNPDQRIAEDVNTFTTQTLSIALILLNSAIALCSFSGVLWSITPWLFLAALAYAAFGSGLTILVGRKLVGLDVQQYKKEADLRYDLIRVREHAEPIALLHGEPSEAARVGGRLARVIENTRRIIRINRNLRFFTAGFDYMTQLIPVLIVAPLYIRGEVEFGVVTQSVGAFMTALNAFSVLVKEFQRITTFAAVVERLSAFHDALEGSPDKAGLEVAEDEERLAYERLTLVTPDEGRLLIADLSLAVPRGKRLLIVGPEGSGRTSLLRATAGHWKAGQGRITRPPLEGSLFLTQQPHLPPGTLRDQLAYSCHGPVSDHQVVAALAAVGLEGLAERVGGLDVERDWRNVLSLTEQQTLAFARLLLARPRYAFLDEATSALDAKRVGHLYELLSRTATPYVTVASGNATSLVEYHDVLLRLGGDGTWQAEELSEEPAAVALLAGSARLLPPDSGRCRLPA